MTWILLQNGDEQHLTGPEALKPAYTIETIAHQLALINRLPSGLNARPWSMPGNGVGPASSAPSARR